MAPPGGWVALLINRSRHSQKVGQKTTFLSAYFNRPLLVYTYRQMLARKVCIGGKILFSDVLRNKRKAKGWSQQKLAERAHLSLRTICYLESGSTNPTFDTVCALANALECTTDDLREADSYEDEETQHKAG